MRLELGENGELLTDSCSPLVEWERSQSRDSSWLRSCGDGPYLQEVEEKIKVEAGTQQRLDFVTEQDDLDSDCSDFLQSEEGRRVLSSQISSQDQTGWIRIPKTRNYNTMNIRLILS